jgi:riboflavin synthase
MFTGLIEEIGKVLSIVKSEKSARITVAAHKILDNVRLGDSISTNGVCLTVTDLSKNHFSVDVMAETMRRSNLHQLTSGDKVNLERALRVGDRLGGHIVSGHIDGMGTIVGFEKEDNAIWVTMKAEKVILKYIVHKGSITIDGISLTVAYVDDSFFKVSIIPHTRDETTLLSKKVGDAVNLECDVLGKYVEKLLLQAEQLPVDKDINMEFLMEHGFA